MEKNMGRGGHNGHCEIVQESWQSPVGNDMRYYVMLIGDD